MIERVLEYKELYEVLVSHNISLKLACEAALRAVYGVSMNSLNNDSDSLKEKEIVGFQCGQPVSHEEEIDTEELRRHLLLPRQQMSATEQIQVVQAFRQRLDGFSRAAEVLDWLRQLVQPSGPRVQGQ